MAYLDWTKYIEIGQNVQKLARNTGKFHKIYEKYYEMYEIGQNITKLARITGKLHEIYEEIAWNT